MKRKMKWMLIIATTAIILIIMPKSVLAEENNMEVSYFDDGGRLYTYTVDGVKNYYPVPPEGFNPVTATDEQLERYGFPARPLQEDKLLEWNEQMSHYSYTPVPEVLVSAVKTVSKAELVKLQTLRYYSSIYQTTHGYCAGYAAYGNTYCQVQGDFVQPTIASSCTNYTYACHWIGMGDFNGSKIFKAGTVMNTYSGGRNYYPVYSYRGTFIRLTSMSVNAGDQIHIYCSFQSANDKLNVYIANNTNGTSQSVLIDVSASEYYDGSMADFMTENIQVNGNYNGLANFGTIYWTNCQVGTLDGNWYSLGSQNVYLVRMSGSSGYKASPQGINGTTFNTVWNAY